MWRRKASLKQSDLLTIKNLVLRDLEFEEILQFLRLYLVVHMYAIKDGRIQALVLHIS